MTTLSLSSVEKYWPAAAVVVVLAGVFMFRTGVVHMPSMPSMPSWHESKPVEAPKVVADPCVAPAVMAPLPSPPVAAPVPVPTPKPVVRKHSQRPQNAVVPAPAPVPEVKGCNFGDFVEGHCSVK